MIDLNKLAIKILRCRSNLKLSLEEVHELSGISIERLTQIENANIEPSGDEILILADVYREDYKYFISNEKLSASEKVEELYREKGNIFTKEDRKIIQNFIILCENEQFVWNALKKEQKTFAPNFNRERILKKDGESVAKQLRIELGYDDKTYLNLYADFRKLGIHIFRSSLSGSSLSGLYIKHPYAGSCILINYDENTYRQNFTLAHEVGHALMDGNNYNISFMNEGTNNSFREYRANNFASCFLVPRDIIKNIDRTTISKSFLKNQAKKFRINVIALLIALKEAEIIREEEFDLYRKMNITIPINEQIDYEFERLTDKLEESYRRAVERSLSPSYIRDCYSAYENRIISENRLAEMLMTDIHDLPNLLNLFSLKLNYSD